MNKTDRDALKLAWEYAGREPGRAQQLEDKLKGLRKEGFQKEWAIPPASWEEVAKFAAYCAQHVSLNLRPWETPPCSCSADGDGPGSALLRRLLAAGLSRFEPDPAAALAREEAA